MSEYGTVQECVARGVRYLDARDPEWFRRIDLNHLKSVNYSKGSFDAGDRCPLDLLFGDRGFDDFLESQGMGTAAYGFNAVYDADDKATTAEWHRVVRELRGEASAS